MRRLQVEIEEVRPRPGLGPAEPPVELAQQDLAVDIDRALRGEAEGALLASASLPSTKIAPRRMPTRSAVSPKSSAWPEKTPTSIAVGEEIADQRLAVVDRRELAGEQALQRVGGEADMAVGARARRCRARRARRAPGVSGRPSTRRPIASARVLSSTIRMTLALAAGDDRAAARSAPRRRRRNRRQARPGRCRRRECRAHRDGGCRRTAGGRSGRRRSSSRRGRNRSPGRAAVATASDAVEAAERGAGVVDPVDREQQQRRRGEQQASHCRRLEPPVIGQRRGVAPAPAQQKQHGRHRRASAAPTPISDQPGLAQRSRAGRRPGCRRRDCGRSGSSSRR